MRALLVAALCLLPLVRFALEDDVPAMGFDESMNAALPSVRMVLYARQGELGRSAKVLHECVRYPFVYPLVLACAQGLVGVGEGAMRWTGVAFWCLGLLGIWLLGRALARRLAAAGALGPGAATALPLLALALAAPAPLAQRYAPTLFLEMPCATMFAFALWAWVRRGEAGAARDLLAGVAIVLALFTKFNYGILLGAGLLADLGCEGLGALRAGGGVAFAKRAAWIAAPVVAVCLWWFLWPWPGEAYHASAHREGFLTYLSGNLEGARASGRMRTLYWTTGFAGTPLVAGVLVAGVVASFGARRVPAVRVLWLAFLATNVPVWVHPFHLDRFLLPGGVSTWCLAAVGWTRLAAPALELGARAMAGPAAALVALVLQVVPAPSLAGPIGFWSPDPVTRAHQARNLARWRQGRGVASSGPPREEFRALVDCVTGALGPDERPGWVRMPRSLTPASLHLALYERGGSAERFLRDAHLPADLPGGPDGPVPDAPRERFAAFVEDFDVLFVARPSDHRMVPEATLERYRERLVALGFRPREACRLELGEPARALDAYRRDSPR